MTGPYRLDRTLIRVSGPDAVSFLNNLLTQDVSKLETAGAQYAALLSPQGKVIADAILSGGEGGSIFLDVDETRRDELLRRLLLFKLRADVAIEDCSSDVALVFDASAFDGAHVDPRFPDGGLGWRKIVAKDADAGLPLGNELFEAQRLAFGIPDLASDAAPEEVFALEALLEELNGVDFQKGCFIGQENVSRMKRRATTRKKFCPITFDGEAPAFGAPVRAGEAEIGSVRTGVRGRAIALLRLDRAHEAMEHGVNLTAAGREVRLDPPPWLILAKQA